jgi:hypothetical protein
MSRCDVCNRDVDDGVACGDCDGHEEHEATIATLTRERDAALERVKVLEEALRFYADSDDYQSSGPYTHDEAILSDCGAIARAALTPKDTDTKGTT